MPPLSLEKARLMQAGLGLKSVTLIERSDPQVFIKELEEVSQNCLVLVGLICIWWVKRTQFWKSC